MYPAAPPPPEQPKDPPGLPWVLITVIGVLCLSGAVLSQLPGPRPVWSAEPARWLTTVPGSLWLLIVGAAVLCVILAVVVTGRVVDLGRGHMATWLWVGLLLLAAAALVWSALYDAALSTIDFGAPIPVLHWLFSFAPAVLAGAVFSGRDRTTRRWAALGTGVVTVPLFALSWGLMYPPRLAGADIVAVLIPTAALAVAPLVGGVALAGVIGRQPHRPTPWPYPPPR